MITSGPKILAPVEIRIGRRSAKAVGVLDSGAPRTIVTFGLLERLGVARNPEIKEGDWAEVPNEMLPTYDVRLDLVRLPEIRCAVGPIAAWATPKLEPAEVVLGVDFMKAGGVSVAFAPSYELVADGKRARPRSSGSAQRLFRRFRFRHGKKVATAKALIDTGATDIVLPQKLARALGAPVAKGKIVAGMVRQVEELDRTSIDSVELVGEKHSKAGPFQVLVSSIWPWPVVGTSYLATIAAFVDFKTGMVQPNTGTLLHLISQQDDLRRSILSESQT